MAALFTILGDVFSAIAMNFWHRKHTEENPESE
ncbi:hypothetical protein JOD21_002007 [Jeotgalibacillus terrae]|nr:hypothetical protein [Jeotgalibacillus terrae]